MTPNTILLVSLVSVISAAAALQAENIVFPADAGLVDVTQPPYSLKGDGRTDNTAALRRAFLELRGSNLTLYFPNGVYLLSDRVNISGDEPSMPHSKDRFLHIQGQSQAGVVLKLKDRSPGFDNAEKPKTFISLYEGKSTGDMMHAYVRNITVEIGAGNPGAAAVRYLTNNSGAVYDVTIRSVDPQKAGAIGLDLRQSQNGPGLIKNITIDGFDAGIQTANTFSLVFEHIAVSNQRKAGFVTGNARITMRNFKSQNNVPALVGSKHTNLTLIDANLLAQGSKEAAIVLEGGNGFFRNIKNTGYAHTIRTADGKFVDGAVTEWFGGKAYSLFDCQEMRTLNLPVEETPEVPWETDLSKWVAVEPGNDGLQQAIDEAAKSGKTTVYFPKMRDKKVEYTLTKPVRVHGSVSRIIGMETILRVSEGIPVGEAAIVLENLNGPFVFERFFNILKQGGWKGLYDRYLFENKSDHPVIVRNIAHGALMHKKPAPGKIWFMEDVAGATLAEFGPGEKVWMRQYNPESPDRTMCSVDGGQAWILGLKTEGRATHLIAKNGASVELLGGVSYQSWKKQPLDPPMFLIEDSHASLTVGFYHYNLPFTTVVEEKRGGQNKTLLRTELKPYHLPLYRACGGTR